MEQSNAIDVYYDMDIAQICQHFSKSRNTVDKAVAKLVKDFPDKHYKYKNPDTRRITITAEGIEKLSGYFRKEKHDISTVEMELRYENEKLQAILAERQKAMDAMETLYQEKLKLEIEKSQQTFLLETQSKDEQIHALESEKESLSTQLNLKTQELSDKSVKLTDAEKKLEEYRRREAEYNSKSFFYRLTHKFQAE